MMARLNSTYSEEDIRSFRLFKISKTTTPRIMRCVLQWGSKKPAGMSFFDYIKETQEFSNVKLNKTFQSYQREKIRNSSCDHFDASLLFICIQNVCESLAPENSDAWKSGESLEHYLSQIKKARNDVVHEYNLTAQSFGKEIESVRGNLRKVLEKAGELYNQDTLMVNQLIQELDKEINKIRDENIDTTGRDMTVDNWYRDRFCYQAGQDIRERYKRLVCFHPLSNLLGTNKTILVENVFTKLTLRKDSESMCYEDLLLCVKDKQEERNIVVVVEGEPGAGKSTLTHKILHDWSKGIPSMTHLLHFDLVLFYECRNKEIKSLNNLLTDLMPKASRIVQHDKLVDCIIDKDILFIVDGLDELNSLSSKVLDQILYFGHKCTITLLCTSRTSGLQDVMQRLPNGFDLVHMTITGIDGVKRQTEFIDKYSKELEVKDSERLVMLIQEKSLKLRLQLPFNLVLVILMWWLNKEDTAVLNTATELFYHTLKQIKEYLIKRLINFDPALVQSVTKKKVCEVLHELCGVALHCHSQEDVQLPRDSAEKLVKSCESHGLPTTKVLEAFLIHAVSLNGDVYSFPHKGLQDFYAALYIVEILKAKEDELQSVMKEATKGDFTPRKYVYILYYIAGLATLDQWRLSEARAQEMVDLLHEAGVRSEVRWLNLLAEVHCDDQICKLIAARLNLPKKIEVKEHNVLGFAYILRYKQPTYIDIKLNYYATKIHELQMFFTAAIKIDPPPKIKLQMISDFLAPSESNIIEKPVDVELCKLLERCQVTTFKGQLKFCFAISMPKCVQHLSVSLLGQECKNVLAPLCQFEDPHVLHTLCLYILHLQDVKLHALPSVKNFILIVQLPSNLTPDTCLFADILRTLCKIFRTTLNAGSRSLRFVVEEGEVNVTALRNIIKGLAAAHVTMEGAEILVSQPYAGKMTSMDETAVKELAWKKLKSGFRTCSHEEVFQ